jgi:hypothetical protein
MEMRMSRAFLRVPAYLPSSVDVTEAMDIIFYCVHALEQGMVVPAAVRGEQATVKGSVYSLLGDSPQQAQSTHTKGPGAIIFCQACLHPSASVVTSDQV